MAFGHDLTNQALRQPAKASVTTQPKGTIKGATTMNNTPTMREDTPAWVFQVWIGFVSSTGMMMYGILNLKVDFWVQGYLGMGLLFVVSSCFALAKTLRDQQENRRFGEAKAEKILSELEFKRP
jgi:hypothetical protein